MNPRHEAPSWARRHSIDSCCGIIKHAPHLNNKLATIMFYAALKTIHLLSVIVWIGGMVFVQFFLRPALMALAPPERVRLMHAVLGRFLKAVLLAAALILGSGAWMIARQSVQSGGLPFSLPLEWLAMALLGLLMMAILGYVRLVLYKRLTRAVMEAAWPLGGAVLAQIRTWVMVNLLLGVLIVVLMLLGASS